MEKFIKGDIVVVPFPFSDLSATKRRPALLLADSSAPDVILCQITSQTVFDKFSLTLNNDELKNGTLNTPSNLRPNKLFTAEKSIILYKIDELKPEKMRTVISAVVKIFQSP